QLLLGIFRMGFLVNFLSKPVISGFTSAAAIIIGFSQLKHLLGIETEQTFHLHEIVQYSAKEIKNTNGYALVIGLVGIMIIWGIRKWKKAVPGSLIVMVLGITISYFFDLTQEGVQILGDIPKGLPGFQVPSATSEQILALTPMAIALALV